MTLSDVGKSGAKQSLGRPFPTVAEGKHEGNPSYPTAQLPQVSPEYPFPQKQVAAPPMTTHGCDAEQVEEVH